MPVVVKGATVPNPKLLPESIRWLCDFQQSELRADPFFKDDVARLLAELIRIRDRLKEQQTQKSQSGGSVRPGAAEPGGAIRCGSCHAQCDRADQFCQVCGAGLWTSCPSCDLPVPQNQVFCGGCGSNLPKLRELIELTEKNEKRFAKIVAISDAAERMRSMDILSREVDAAIRIFPKHQPLAHLQFQTNEVYRKSARELADSVYESGKLHAAREHYVSLKQIDPLSDHPSTRLAEIETRYKTDVAKCRERIAKGDFKRAVDGLANLCTAFPEDTQLKSELQRCEAVVARLNKLVPEGLRELKRKRHFIALEQELLWLRQEQIPVKNLVEWLNDVKSVNRKANEDYLQAQSELREGRFRQTQKLANAILKTVADHEGAKGLLTATSGTETIIAQLNALLQKEHFCAANLLAKRLEQSNISDPRITKLVAKTNVEIASLDSSIRVILILFFVGCIPGYVLGNKLFEMTGSQLSADGGLLHSVVWLSTILAMPMFLVTVIFAATSHRAERISRFFFDWLPFGRIFRANKSNDDVSIDSNTEANEAEKIPPNTPIAASRPAEPIVLMPQPLVSTVHSEAMLDTTIGTRTEPTKITNPHIEANISLTVDIDRSAALAECLFVGVLTFCLSVACGHLFWDWLLGLRFDASLESDARTLEILRPFSAVFPLFAMSVLSIALESAARWRRIMLVGGIGILVDFVMAILFPAATSVIHFLLLTAILMISISEFRRIEFWRVVLMQVGGLAGASLVMSAVAVPLAFAAEMLGFEIRSIFTDSFKELAMTTLFLCQIFVSSSSAGSIQISRLAAEYPVVRGTLSIGSSWIAAAIVYATARWLTTFLKDEWHGPGEWVVLLLLIQSLPFVLCGPRGFAAQRPWFLLSSIWITVMSLLWWIVPTAAVLVFPATFALSAISLLRLETMNFFERWGDVVQQLKLRQSRRMFMVRQLLRRA